MRRSATDPTASVGTIVLGTTDSGEAAIPASWLLLSGPPARSLRPSRPRSGEIAIELVFPTGEAPTSGLLARGVLALEVGGEVFRVPVLAYSLDRLNGTPRMVKAPGQTPDGAGLIVYWGEPSLTTFLELETHPPVPILWEGIDCPHGAIAIRPIDPAVAATTLRAEVTWESALLDPEARVQQVPFRLRFFDLPPKRYDQQVRWRKRDPLVFRPSVLIVPWLVEGRAERFPLEVTNDDRVDIVVHDVIADAPWVAAGDPAASGDRRLAPGERATFELTLDPRLIDAAGPPASARVQVRMANRGGQWIPVRVEAIRPIRVLNSPLLIDPGPPRIVVARRDGPTGNILFPTASGDSGWSPEALGVSAETYARAVRGAGDVEVVIGQLLQGAIDRVFETELWKARDLRVCRQPWVPAGLDFRGVEFRPWWGVGVTEPATDLDILLRIGAWSVEAVERFKASARPLVLPPEVARPSIGSFVRDWLAARILPRLRRAEADPPTWLILAAERLLTDYRRGPEQAWKRLVREWRRCVPEARHVEIDLVEADEALTKHSAGVLRRVAEALWVIAADRDGRAAITWLGPFLHGERRSALIDLTRRFIDVDLDSDDLPWVERLAE